MIVCECVSVAKGRDSENGLCDGAVSDSQAHFMEMQRNEKRMFTHSQVQNARIGV